MPGRQLTLRRARSDMDMQPSPTGVPGRPSRAAGYVRRLDGVAVAFSFRFPRMSGVRQAQNVRMTAGSIDRVLGRRDNQRPPLASKPSRRTADPRVLATIAIGVLLLAAALSAPVRTAIIGGTGLWTPTRSGTSLDELVFNGFTALGDGSGLVAIVSTVTIGLLVTRRPIAATFIVLAAVGASLVTRLLKDLYQAPRPPTFEQATFLPHAIPGALVLAVVILATVIGLIRGWGMASVGFGVIVIGVLLLERASSVVPVNTGFDSFPSGHALNSVTVATAIVLMTWGDKRWRWPVTVAAVVYTLMVGISRLYLGVHYPADVLAGWCVGIAWTLFLWLVMRISARWRRERVIRLAVPGS